MREITAKQRQLYEYIRDFTATHGYAPSIREIAQHFQVYVKAIMDKIQALEKKGYLTHESGLARTLKIINSLPETDE